MQISNRIFPSNQEKVSDSAFSEEQLSNYNNSNIIPHK